VPITSLRNCVYEIKHNHEKEGKKCVIEIKRSCINGVCEKN
jgi:hypothetical protein